jgi:hypothetical protein
MSGNRPRFPGCGAKAARNPRLLFVFSGLFLFRLADRTFLEELFQLPPRFTRFVATYACPGHTIPRPATAARKAAVFPCSTAAQSAVPRT